MIQQMFAIWSLVRLPFLKPSWTSGISRFCWSLAWRILNITLLACAATAKSLQSCPTLCNPIDSSPPGSPVPGILQASLIAQLVKNPAAIQETWGLIPGLGRCAGERNGYPLQYSGLENSMDCIVHGVAKSRTRLINFHSSVLEAGESGFWSGCFAFAILKHWKYPEVKQLCIWGAI